MGDRSSITRSSPFLFFIYEMKIRIRLAYSANVWIVEKEVQVLGIFTRWIQIHEVWRSTREKAIEIVKKVFAEHNPEIVDCRRPKSSFKIEKIVSDKPKELDDQPPKRNKVFYVVKERVKHFGIWYWRYVRNEPSEACATHIIKLTSFEDAEYYVEKTLREIPYDKVALIGGAKD
jgi:hypothetical protein